MADAPNEVHDRCSRELQESQRLFGEGAFCDAERAERAFACLPHVGRVVFVGGFSVRISILSASATVHASVIGWFGSEAGDDARKLTILAGFLLLRVFRSFAFVAGEEARGPFERGDGVCC